MSSLLPPLRSRATRTRRFRLILFPVLFFPILPSLADEPQNPIQQAIIALSRQLQNHIVESAGLGKMSTVPAPSDADHRRALDAILSQFLTISGDNYRTLQRLGNTSTPIEITGLSLNGPHPSALSDADRLNGIDSRVIYSFSAKGHRTYTSGGGWSEWKPSKPALMSGLTLERKNGRWVTIHSPITYFSNH